MKALTANGGLRVASAAADEPGIPLSVAMLAPPWIAIPPSGYGGIETVVADLTDALVRRGNAVTLFCAPGSRSSAHTVELLEEAHASAIERALFESDHVASAFAAIDAAQARGMPFDVVHDHCGFTALAMADRLATPLVHTLHGPFSTETTPFYERHGHKALLVGISRAQLAGAPAGLRDAAVVPNPIDVRSWPFCEQKQDYLLWVGRMTPEKGAHRAIAAARAAGVPLVLAGVIQPGQQSFFDRDVAPHLDGANVRFVGEIAGAGKRSLFARARALLMPIRWNEPFGMVMVEALATGTPVIAFREGSACELIIHGHTGFVVDDELEMAAAVAHVNEIDPRVCRAYVAERCDVNAVARAYEAVYRAACAPAATRVEPLTAIG